MTTAAIDPPAAIRHRGPSLFVVALVFAGLFVASLVVTAVMSHGAHFPSPFDSAAAARAFFSDHPDAVRTSAFLQFGAAIPLAIFSATASSRLRFFGIEAAGPTIALIGGALASSMAALSALLQWVLVQPGIDDGAALRVIHLLAFATGGPGTVVPFGILIAGVAVSAGIARRLPRSVMWCGLAIALAAELSSLAIALPAAAYLLPIARFSGLIWLIVAGAKLPVARASQSKRTMKEVTS